jgi:hypothetical protein
VSAPKHVQIGPYRYRLVLDRAAIDKISAAEGERHLGQCDTDRLVVTVDPDLAPDCVREVALHELLHALFALIGASDAVSHDLEESLVRRLSPALYGALRANEGLVSWLTD